MLASLVAHSLAEAYLYLMATPCPSCGEGPLRGSEPDAAAGEPSAIQIRAECGACHATSSWRFQLPPHDEHIDSQGSPVINPTPQLSRILDVAQWITLAEMMSAAADGQPDRQAARRLRLEAGECLEEALKFYAPDNDLPPAEAFFHAGSRDRLRQSPEQFSRQRLLGLRSKLPKESPLHPQ